MQYRNCNPTDVMDGTKRYRLTFEAQLSSWLPSWAYNAPVRATTLYEWLPSKGVVPVSSPNATQGDEAIVFDVKPAVETYGRNLSTMASMLSDVPGFPDLETLVSIEGITYTSQADLKAQQAAAIKQAEVEANRNPLIEATKDATATVWRDVRNFSFVALAVVAVAVVAIAYGPNIGKLVGRR